MMNFLTESLKEPIDGDFLITSGREFHKTGPKQLIGSCFIFKTIWVTSILMGKTSNVLLFDLHNTISKLQVSELVVYTLNCLATIYNLQYKISPLSSIRS